MRKSLVVAALSAGLLLPLPSALVAGASPATGDPRATGDLSVTGRGFGHGRGMSQYGAQGAAQAGLTSAQILGFYYPGTLPTRTAGFVRIHVTGDTTSGLTVLPAPGLRVRDLGDNRGWVLPRWTGITRWSIEPYGDHQTRLLYYYAPLKRWAAFPNRKVFKKMSQFEGPATNVLVMPNGTGNRFRGGLRAADRSGASLDTLNVVRLEHYLRGVVPRESPSSWRPAALQAQAVAARTYSAYHRARSTGRDYDLCDTTSCQVYGGHAAEKATTNAAIAATDGSVRTRNGAPIIAEFSSSNGGWTAAGPVLYQVAKADPYDGRAGNKNPNTNWSVLVSRARAESAFGVGRITRIAVTSRDGHGATGGRVLRVQVTGSAGQRSFSGNQVRSRLRLKSNWFSFA